MQKAAVGALAMVTVGGNFRLCEGRPAIASVPFNRKHLAGFRALYREIVAPFYKIDHGFSRLGGSQTPYT